MEQQTKEQRKEELTQLYGADTTEWLKRWDNGDVVWSIEMGGMGPGYEQCIHITAAEIVRYMLEQKYDESMWDVEELWGKDRDEIQEMGLKNEVIKKLGLSGAQWGAAFNLAVQFYRHGPYDVMTDERVKDRKIQVSKNFPEVAA